MALFKMGVLQTATGCFVLSAQAIFSWVPYIPWFYKEAGCPWELKLEFLSFSDRICYNLAERLARLEVDSDFTAPCNTSILYPTAGGNIHSFTAWTPCAVLDVMGPPYSKADDRDCTYYREFPCSSSGENFPFIFIKKKINSSFKSKFIINDEIL